MAPTTQHSNPGKTLGIIGFIFSFIAGLQIVGLILSIIGYNKSKKAGHTNTLALVGIILNSIALFLAILILPITLISYNGIVLKANSASALSAATTIVAGAEAYNANTGAYPTTFAQARDATSFSDPTTAPKDATDLITTTKPLDAKTVWFYTCGADGNKVGYWNYSQDAVQYLYSGKATTTSTCTFVAN